MGPQKTPEKSKGEPTTRDRVVQASAEIQKLKIETTGVKLAVERQKEETEALRVEIGAMGDEISDFREEISTAMHLIPTVERSIEQGDRIAQELRDLSVNMATFEREIRTELKHLYTDTEITEKIDLKIEKHEEQAHKKENTKLSIPPSPKSTTKILLGVISAITVVVLLLVEVVKFLIDFFKNQ